MKTANLGELLGEAATKFVEVTPLGRDPEPQIGSGAKRRVTTNLVGETLSIAERGNEGGGVTTKFVRETPLDRSGRKRRRARVTPNFVGEILLGSY